MYITSCSVIIADSPPPSKKEKKTTIFLTVNRWPNVNFHCFMTVRDAWSLSAWECQPFVSPLMIISKRSRGNRLKLGELERVCMCSTKLRLMHEWWISGTFPNLNISIQITVEQGRIRNWFGLYHNFQIAGPEVIHKLIYLYACLLAHIP